MIHHIRFALFAIAAGLWLYPASSQTGSSQPEWINAVRSGGYVIVFRHGATHVPPI
jgi:hypothetical protein